MRWKIGIFTHTQTENNKMRLMHVTYTLISCSFVELHGIVRRVFILIIDLNFCLEQNLTVECLCRSKINEFIKLFSHMCNEKTMSAIK